MCRLKTCAQNLPSWGLLPCGCPLCRLRALHRQACLPPLLPSWSALHRDHSCHHPLNLKYPRLLWGAFRSVYACLRIPSSLLLQVPSCSCPSSPPSPQVELAFVPLSLSQPS